MSLRFLVIVRVASLGASLSTLCSGQSISPIVVDEAAARVSFPGSSTQLALPIINRGARLNAEIMAELLDPTNTVRSHAEQTCDLASGQTICRITLPAATADAKRPDGYSDDLPLFRVRYTVASSNAAPFSGMLARDRVAPGLFELHVAAPKDIRRGATYTARVRALHPLTHAPIANLGIKVTLTESFIEDRTQDAVFDSKLVATDSDGFASITFNAPNDKSVVSVDLALESTLAGLRLGTSQTLEIPQSARLDFTTDKPLYQPGQTVHTRLLLLDYTGHASGAKTIRVDISDPDSTLVFRGEAVTSTFGIATIDWPVPARIRLGGYSLKASVLDGPDEDVDSGNQATFSSVRISRYDLPTFVVTPKTDRPFYLPGTNANSIAVVDVRADYLFGKPVLHGRVRVVREDDRTWNFATQSYDMKEGKAVSGPLDAHGNFRASIPLDADLKPYRTQFASNNLQDVHFAAYVTDASTGRTEQRRFDIRVAAQAIQLVVKSDRQAAGLPEQLYLAATTADGIPVECELMLSLLPRETSHATPRERVALGHRLQSLHTDANGLARISLPVYENLLKLVPQAPIKSTPSFEEPTVYIAARDATGRTGSITQSISPPTETLRITTPQSLCRSRDLLAINIDSATPSLPVTVQVFRHTLHGDLTLAMRNIALVDGHAELTIPTDARFAGVVYVQAVALGIPPRKSSGYGDSYWGNGGNGDRESALAGRAILFPRDNSLHVGIRMSAETYRPGEEATAALTVRGPIDSDGDDETPTPSALGIVAVDQAVTERNRTDSDFGSGRSSFFFEESFGFGSDGSAGIFTLASLNQLDLSKPIPPDAQLAVEILLVNRNFSLATFNNSASDNLAEVFKPMLDAQLVPARLALIQYLNTHPELPSTEPELSAVLADRYIDLHAFRDPWGTPYTITFTPGEDGSTALKLRSDGPDRLHATVDDFDIPLASFHWFEQRQSQLKEAVVAFHQSAGRYIRSLDDLRAEMTAEHIDIGAWRDPWGHPFIFHFSINTTNFVVEVFSKDDTAHASRYEWVQGPYLVGSASIDYTLDLKRRVEATLNLYAASHVYPTTMAEFNAAIRASRISPAQLTDPWRRPLFVSFHTHSFFTDRVNTEAHATPASAPRVRTIVTPVTAIADIIELRSGGAKGGRNSSGTFTFASFSRVRSMQGAHDQSAIHTAHAGLHSGPTGDITGFVTDQTGALIPGATVLATNVNTGDAFEEKSDKDGRYLIGPLPVGTYKLRVSLNGFMPLTYDQVTVTPQDVITLDAKLFVGSVSEAVEVSADVAVLNTNSASIATVSPVLPAPPPLPLLNRAAVKSLLLFKPGFGLAMTEAAPTPRLRDYFPETLLWRPEIVTAPDGTATLHFPVADNITTWQLSAAASTIEGNTGSGSTSFQSFQPFFAAFDPPSILTVGDTIALPVTLHNYLDHSVSVTSSLTPAPWFKLSGTVATTTEVKPQESASPVFEFTALTAVRDAEQQFTAQPISSGTDEGDRIARPVTIHPNGLESAVTAAGILSPGRNSFTLTTPGDMIAGSSDLTLKLYPNLAAHLRDALATMAGYPSGCAEQILSTAWPSLLLHRYTAAFSSHNETLNKQTGLQLQQAYENLLTNQLAGGGFAYWARDRDADLALTAYAVQFLHEAQPFIAADDNVLNRAVAYLAAQQGKDGLWVQVDRDRKPHPEDIRGNAMLTASIAAAIAGAPNAEPLLTKALPAIQSIAEEFDEPYTLAGFALTAIALNDTVRRDTAIIRLRSLALTENGGAYWSLETNTPFFGWGRAGRAETTAMVLRALLAASPGQLPDDLITRGLLFLNHEQDRHSLWYSTQATARVLDVLAAIVLRSPVAPAGTGGETLAVSVDNHTLAPIPLSPVSQDSGPIFVSIAPRLAPGPHAVTLSLPSSASTATAQLVANLYRAWPEMGTKSAASHSVVNNEQLRLTLAFSNTRSMPGKPIVATAHIERIGFRGYGMLIAELGLPPGADVDRASLESALAASGFQLNQYEILPDKVLLYVWPRAGELTLHFKFTVRYGIEALAAPSTVYDYYNPMPTSTYRLHSSRPASWKNTTEALQSIARKAPYCLFLDELNACSHEVQKAFYSLNRRNAFRLHDEPCSACRPTD